MALPWQTDTASCRNGYDKTYDPYAPTFWPARVPNQVLAEADYDTVMDTSLPIEERRAAFERRAVWLRFLDGDKLHQINQMITEFGRFGVVERRAGPGDPEFPAQILVESEVGFPTAGVPLMRNLFTLHVPEAADPAEAPQAIAYAVARTGLREEEVTAGFIDKVQRFTGRRRRRD